MEWAPPYNWRAPTRTKEEQIQQAVRVAAEQLGDRVVAVVPVCSAAGRLFGVDDGLLPIVAERLGEARTVALLRCIKAETDAGKVRKLFRQLIDFGTEAAQVLWKAAK